MLAVSRQRLAQLVLTYDDFPEPEVELASGRVWATEAIEAWKNKHLIRPSGPRRRRLEAGLYECFSESLRNAIRQSEDEAKRLEHNLVGTPHLLIALLAAPDTDVREVAARTELDVPALRNATTVAYATGMRKEDGKYPFTPRAKEALERAVRAAFLCRDDEVRPVHLVHGMAEMREPSLVQVLTSVGTSAEALSDAAIDRLAEPEGPMRHAGGSGP